MERNETKRYKCVLEKTLPSVCTETNWNSLCSTGNQKNSWVGQKHQWWRIEDIQPDDDFLMSYKEELMFQDLQEVDRDVLSEGEG